MFTGGIMIGTGVLVLVSGRVGGNAVGVEMTGAGVLGAVGAAATCDSANGPISALVLLSKKKLNTQKTTKFKSSR